MSKSKEMCQGCRNNHYNQNVKGGCWSYPTAKIVSRVKVGVWQSPPYAKLPIRVLSCHSPEGYVYLELNDMRIAK